MNQLRIGIKWLGIVVVALALSSCDAPVRDTIAVVGGTLLGTHGQVLQDHCMVVIREGKYIAVGSQAMIPLPKTSQVVDSLNHFVVAGKTAAPQSLDDLVTPQIGEPALLLILPADPRQDGQAFTQPLHVIRNQTIQ